MSDVVLGELPTGSDQRDAIHVAVIPMIAAEMLRPGQRVGILENGTAGISSKITGIVDPYLTDVVPKGSLFWMCLLPGTVTGMRHHWSHAEFDSKVLEPVDTAKRNAEAWLRAQCRPLGCLFEDLVSPDSDLVSGEYILSDLNEYARDHWYSIENEFWKQHAIFTGKVTPEDRKGGFTCAC